jgi:hypothetical protein
MRQIFTPYQYPQGFKKCHPNREYRIGYHEYGYDPVKIESRFRGMDKDDIYA